MKSSALISVMCSIRWALLLVRRMQTRGSSSRENRRLSRSDKSASAWKSKSTNRLNSPSSRLKKWQRWLKTSRRWPERTGSSTKNSERALMPTSFWRLKMLNSSIKRDVLNRQLVRWKSKRRTSWPTTETPTCRLSALSILLRRSAVRTRNCLIRFKWLKKKLVEPLLLSLNTSRRRRTMCRRFWHWKDILIMSRGSLKKRTSRKASCSMSVRHSMKNSKPLKASLTTKKPIRRSCRGRFRASKTRRSHWTSASWSYSKILIIWTLSSNLSKVDSVNLRESLNKKDAHSTLIRSR